MVRSKGSDEALVKQVQEHHTKLAVMEHILNDSKSGFAEQKALLAKELEEHKQLLDDKLEVMKKDILQTIEGKFATFSADMRSDVRSLQDKELNRKMFGDFVRNSALAVIIAFVINFFLSGGGVIK